MSHIKEFLEAEVKLLEMSNVRPRGEYRCLGEFVLKNGIDMGEMRQLPAWIQRGRMKECFRNAAILSCRWPDKLIYCEGYALSILPVMHAWCIDHEMNVIDPTWKEGHEYLGIPFKRSYLARMQRITGTYGIIDQWQHGFPILTDDPKLWRHQIYDNNTTNRNTTHRAEASGLS